MLFTQFRVTNESTRPVLFLFDEPASNLHAAAQKKLIESFPEIAIKEHCLAYTTHSHYMIEPKWLEQTFIVTNRSDAPTESVIQNVSLEDESLDIKAETYRSFVDKNPSQISYFQPILDRLEVVPSHFDIDRPSVIVEGKSDYYILRYGAELASIENFYCIPALGASTFGALSALGAGWNLNFIYILDSDKAGRDGKKKYSKLYGVPENRLYFISDFISEAKNIEDMLDTEANMILTHELSLDKIPEKSQILRFFQQRLASKKITHISTEFDNKLKSLINEMLEILQKYD